MQKLSGISSGQNNKSCSIIHHESNKIGLAFFCFFYDFLRNLQESANSLLLFQLRFCREALGKKFFFAMSPLGAASGGPAAIPSGDHRILAGGGWGSGLGTLRARFEALDRAEMAPASRHAGGGRCQPRQLAVRRGAAREGTVGGGA
jgi:hypothetical protein